MATLHGRNATVYFGTTNGGAASEYGEARKWSIAIDRETDEDMAFGDTWETSLFTKLSWSGSIEGNFDTASANPFSAATQTGTVTMYLYPDRSTTGRYYYGTIWPKLSVDVGLDGVARFTMDFDGSGTLAGL